MVSYGYRECGHIMWPRDHMATTQCTLCPSQYSHREAHIESSDALPQCPQDTIAELFQTCWTNLYKC
jgi:hypothetical protein